MKTLDIKFTDNQVYALKEMTLTTKEYEEMVEAIPYDQEYRKFKKRSSEIESTMLPPFNYAFYTHIFLFGSLPTPMEVFKEYIGLNKDVFTVYPDKNLILFKDKKFLYDAFVGKVYRAYPSLLRDFHFYLMLKEYNEKTHFFDAVSYSCLDDYKGIDIVVKKEGVQFAVSLLANTYSSKTYKGIKNNQRHKYSEMNEISIPLDFSKAKKVGTIFLYSKKDIWFVVYSVNQKLDMIKNNHK